LKKTKELSELKTGAHQYCIHFVNERMNRIQQQIKELQTALTTETKSSAGDKHETGRAMIQLEREKLGRQLAETEKMQQVMFKVSPKVSSDIIGLGNVVVTTTGYYYLAISAGEFKHNGTSVFCISGASPIGRLLLGKSVDDALVFNKTTSLIVAIY
jgi:hypothetical protein